MALQMLNNSQFAIVDSKYHFEIKNFLNYANGETIDSAIVKFFECDIDWRILLHPSVHESDSNQIYTVFGVEIFFKSENLYNTHNFQYRVSGTTGTSEPKKVFESSYKTIDRKYIVDLSNKCLAISITNLLKLRSLFLTVNLEIRHWVGPIFSGTKYCAKNAKVEVADQYLNLLNDSTFSDFTFTVKGMKFKVHKNILASESETMRAMFTTNLREFVQAECVVDHIEPHIFKLMLEFIYAGKIPDDLDNISMDLYRAAHYYRIVKLMDMCTENIHFRLSVSNAQEIYELATLYDMEDVKVDAWKIVKCHIFKIFFSLKDEPLPIKDFLEIIDIKNNEKDFWLKHKKTN